MSQKKIALHATIKQIVVRHGLSYEEAAIAIGKCLKPAAGSHRKPRLSSGYLSKIANGQVPSLKTARAIIRWAKSLREELTLADLGIEVA